MRSILIRLLVLTVVLLTCSCTSYRAKQVQEWEEDHHLMELAKTDISGRYANEAECANESEREREPWLLWTLLTELPSSPTDVVRIEVKDKVHLLATLETETKPWVERRYKVRALPRHVALGTQYHIRGRAFPLFWGLGQNELWLGSAPGDLANLYFVPGVSVMIGPLPIWADGGGPGGVFEFRKLKGDSSNEAPHLTHGLRPLEGGR